MEERMKEVVLDYVDRTGIPQLLVVNTNGGKDCGYAIDDLTARVWTAVGEECETTVIPLECVSFIREVFRAE